MAKTKTNLEHGKLPPQDVSIEEAVLGALMLEKPALNLVKNILHERVFYKEIHQKIYTAILHLSEKETPDLLTVTNELKKRGELTLVGGPYYISQLTNRVSSAANIEVHCMVLFEKFIKREHIRLGSEMITGGYDDTIDPMETNLLISKMSNELLTAIDPNIEISNVDLIRDIATGIENAAKMEGVTGKKTGFAELDDCTNGWQDGDLVILAARPSMGKTALALTMARNMAIQFEEEGAFFSCEMSAEKLMIRLVAAETGFILKKLQKGELDANDWKLFHKKVRSLTSSKLHIIEKTKNINSVKAKAYDLYSKGQLKWMMVDYLQLCQYPEYSKNREREVSQMSAVLKGIATDLNIPVICLSQLSRTVESRTSKKPQLSDLRDSGSIEQDADVVMFLFRAEYYKMKKAVKNQALGIIAKHRNGELKTIKFHFDGPTVHFKDWEGVPFTPNYEEEDKDDLPF